MSQAAAAQKTTKSPAKAKAKTSALPPKKAAALDHRRERLGIPLGLLGLASLLGLVSYTRSTNWVGPVGSWLAERLLGAVGVGAYPIVLAMLTVSLLWLLGKRVPVHPTAIACGVGIFLSSGVLLTLFLTGAIQKHPPAGALGVFLTAKLVSLFSVPGSTILAGSLLCGSIAILADIEIKNVLEALGRSGKVIASPVLAGVEIAQEAWREAKEAHEIARAEAAAQREERRMKRLVDQEEDEEEIEEEEAEERPVEPPTPIEEPRRRGRAKKEEPLPEPVKPEPPKPEPIITSFPGPKIVQEAPVQKGQETPIQEEPRARKGKAKLVTPVEPVITAPIVAAAVAPVVAAAAVASQAPAVVAPLPAPSAEKTEAQRRVEPTKEKENKESEEELDEESAEALAEVFAKPSGGRKPAVEPTIVPPVQRPKPAALTIVEPKLPKKPVIVDEPKKVQPQKEYQLPSLAFLDYKEPKSTGLDRATLTANARKLEQKLLDYHVPGNVVEIHPGPVITMYEFCPGPGIKVSKIAGLSDDLAMALQAERVRIIAPIPGKNAVGIEIPNPTREVVYLKEILADNSFQKAESKLSLGIGKDVSGAPKVADLAKMPHLLVAGATGAGKSVAINTFICSVLFNATPKEVRFLMVDPKMLELSVYEGIPHLLLPVVTDMKKAALALRWAVDEMERRYQLLAEAGVRNIINYNKKVEERRKLWEENKNKPAPIEQDPDIDQELDEEEDDIPIASEASTKEPAEPLPYIVVIIDELADLMMVASRDVETSIARLAQMARAAGIHLILATQRPSVDVITGLIKANFPTRISFQVASRIDSRTILDQQGAENLLGMGDMLMMEKGKVQRFHGALVMEEEIHKVVDYLKQQGTPQYDESILAPRDEDGDVIDEEEEERDVLYDQALAIVMDARQASTSMIQRKLKIGYNRAARLIELMERQGVVGPADGAKPREVLISQIE